MNVEYKIKIEGNIFIVTVKSKDIYFIDLEENSLLITQIAKINNEAEENKKALIRGFFLGSGSINNPENNYHLEISFLNEEILIFAINLLKNLDINVKKLEIKNRHSIYLKDGEEISKFLALIGANKAVLKFEDIRVQREMRVKVNRLVNCETANLNKTINASIKQIEAINKLKITKKFNKLNDNLKEIAELRLKYPDMSLVELGSKLKEPLGKSGVNYRLNKIIEIAEDCQ